MLYLILRIVGTSLEDTYNAISVSGVCGLMYPFFGRAAHEDHSATILLTINSIGLSVSVKPENGRVLSPGLHGNCVNCLNPHQFRRSSYH
ncbi:hypothetical protein A0H81_05082 [Grifola frondosa]|uniref:Uncharacterized protein n=1 Tax=Grifola frondosa TaxID=5627 RepID=A0A1C7MDH8_GRIFR|nr:hypothetical protein A0H81_05082 [Grifola frondosa]